LQNGVAAEGQGWVAAEPLSPLHGTHASALQTGAPPAQAEKLAAVHWEQRLVFGSQSPLTQSASVPDEQPPGAGCPSGASGRQPLGLPDPAQ
jgi:hypothetical protein